VQSAQRFIEPTVQTPTSANLVAFQSIGSTPGRPVLPPVGRLFNENPLKIKNFSEFLKKQSDQNENSKTIDLDLENTENPLDGQSNFNTHRNQPVINTNDIQFHMPPTSTSRDSQPPLPPSGSYKTSGKPISRTQRAPMPSLSRPLSKSKIRVPQWLFQDETNQQSQTYQDAVSYNGDTGFASCIPSKRLDFTPAENPQTQRIDYDDSKDDTTEQFADQNKVAHVSNLSSAILRNHKMTEQ
jgi:hypothetical protein